MQKNKVIKLSALLLSIVLTVVLTVGTAYGRYITEIARNIVFSSQSVQKIYLNSKEISNRTLIGPLEWQKGVNQMSSSLTFSNTAHDSEETPQQDVTFRIRAYVVADPTQQEENAPEITLSQGNTTYPSKIQSISEKTVFYKNNQKNGNFYCFFDSVQAAASDELQFSLAGRQKSEIAFTLTVYNTEISEERIFVCIEQIK